MEQYPPVKGNKLQALVFLEVGLFEVGFVLTGLLLLFGTLNYFNVLPVSTTFPKYLGWLPRREVPNGTSQQVNRLTVKQLPTSTPTPTPTPAPAPTSVVPTDLLTDAV